GGGGGGGERSPGTQRNAGGVRCEPELMDTIRVTCPACKAALEVDADKVGTEVECGECFQVFKARSPGGKSKSAPTTKKGTKPAGRKRRDEDDDYEHDNREEYDEEDYDPNESRAGRASGMPSAGGTFLLGLLAV